MSSPIFIPEKPLEKLRIIKYSFDSILKNKKLILV